MTKVFVHGNPETADIWAGLTSALSSRGVDDVVLLSPPGFGAPIPAGFELSYRSYRAWLIHQLEGVVASAGDPIDLVGHDWGAGHVFGVAAERPDLLRTWAADCFGLLHPEYVWHDAAQLWMQPDVGEQIVAGLVTLDAAALAGLLHVPTSLAAKLAEAIDDDMGRAILGLYRSAPEPELQQLYADIQASERRPALAFLARGDQYVSDELTPAVAQRLDATIADLGNVGHWWMVEQPELAADFLLNFWSANESTAT